MDRYDQLYEMMSRSEDIGKMRIFGRAERWAFELMCRTNSAAAREWLERLEPVAWHNYLSEAEANYIVDNLVDRDGHSGKTWSKNDIEQLAESSGVAMQDEPFYNCWALWATVNMLASDHLASVREFAGDDAPKLLLRMAVEKLHDPDRPEFIRAYFGL